MDFFFFGGENTSQCLLCLEEMDKVRKWARKPRERDGGRDGGGGKNERHQMCVSSAQRSVCLRADIDNFMPPQTCDFSNEPL